MMILWRYQQIANEDMVLMCSTIIKLDLSAGHQCPDNLEFVTKGQEVGHTIEFPLNVYKNFFKSGGVI